jgi:D-alanyl-D-alanine carboxypeptidase/D-alanyl-D-alanine-endopeptidase (penicillin-binding protein 4)
MNQVLNYIWKNDDHLGLINLMPVAGQDGTLKYRSSMRTPPIEGKIRGKSGSIFGSHNMAGYGLDSKGNPASTFVQFISDYHYSVDENAAPTTPPITQFEQAFYNDVLRFSVHQ